VEIFFRHGDEKLLAVQNQSSRSLIRIRAFTKLGSPCAYTSLLRVLLMFWMGGGEMKESKGGRCKAHGWPRPPHVAKRLLCAVFPTTTDEMQASLRVHSSLPLPLHIPSSLSFSLVSLAIFLALRFQRRYLFSYLPFPLLFSLPRRRS